MSTTALTSRQLRNAQEVLIGKLSLLKEREGGIARPIPDPTKSKSITRGGVYGTTASTTILTAFTQAGLAAFKTLEDGVQTSDFTVLAALYPQAATVVQNWSSAKDELGELDALDYFDLARGFLDNAESIALALAGDQELPSRSTISPEAALQAATQALESTRDLVLLGLDTFRDGFNVLTDLPALVSSFPLATTIAANAPLAVQAFSMLDNRQIRALLHTSVDVVFDIIDYLKTAPVQA